jgi:hypothetical protein
MVIIIPEKVYFIADVSFGTIGDRPRLFHRPNRERINRGLSPIASYCFFCIAVNRITSNTIKTIQPYGYGKAPVKKADNVAMSNTIKSPEIQSGLISASPLAQNVGCGNSIPVRLMKKATR